MYAVRCAVRSSERHERRPIKTAPDASTLNDYEARQNMHESSATAGRPVEVFGLDKKRIYTGTFLAWGALPEEFANGVGSYTVALIEHDGGLVVALPTDLFRFLDRDSHDGLAWSATWEPIDSAPKDRRVLASIFGSSCTVVAYWDAHSGHWRDDAEGDEVAPAFWMPMPPPLKLSWPAGKSHE